MSSITTDKGILHYEVFGKGKPIIFLHGWLGSWGLWQKTMEYLGETNRTYALDFWGFGESTDKLSTYRVQDFVELVVQFMDQLGIQKAPLVGHSMGGTVSLMASIRFQNRIEKVVIIGSPIVGSSISLPLKMAGKRIVSERLFLHFGLFRKFLKTLSPLICKHPDFPEIIDRDLSRTNLESFLNSIRSLQSVDLKDDLKNLTIPILGLYGKRDNIVSPAQNRLLKQIIPQSEIELFPKSGHFIMLEEPELCMQRIQKFINEESEIEQ
ncbi:MAG TPA: alpha/beta hydrolase [Anaerolineaceae bacterium]|nr:alpha/beta hydrolase [Anaerolineaceae bacterium]